MSFQDESSLLCSVTGFDVPLCQYIAGLKSCANVHKQVYFDFFFYRQIILLKKSQMLQKGLLSWAWTCPAWAVAMRTFLSWQSLGVGVFPFFSYLGRRHGRSQQWPSLFPHRRVGWEGELRNFGLAPFTYWGSQAARRGTQSEPSTMRTRIASFGKEQTQEPQLKHCFAVGITQPYTALPLSQSSKTRTIFH